MPLFRDSKIEYRKSRIFRAFTLVELLTVIAIIAILAGLILSISGLANKKGALTRASAEIQAISAACESYKADNGTYPHQPLAVGYAIPTSTGTNIPSDLAGVDPRTQGGSTSGTETSSTPGSVAGSSAYGNASLELYEALTGDLSCTGTGGGLGVKNYLVNLRPDTLGRANPSVPVSSTNTVYFLSDPFGNSYGYCTAQANALASGTTSPYGYNPTFDLWSTSGLTSTPYTGASAGQPGDPTLQWIKNW